MTLMATEFLADDRALRTGRRERALAQMEKHNLDVLVLGRQANVRYVSGAPQLWVAGTRPFGPTCVLIRETGAIHLLSTWDEGSRRHPAREPVRHRLESNEHDLAAQRYRGCGDGETSWCRCAVSWLRSAVADGLPQCRTGWR